MHRRGLPIWMSAPYRAMVLKGISATDTLFPLEESRNNRIEISSIKTLGIINYNGTYERKC